MVDRNQDAPLLITLESGGAQFAPAWRAFSSQWTQTQLLNLTREYLKTRAIHSSQIGSLKKGTLTEPGPKLFVALGYFNVALARANKHPEKLIEKCRDIGYAATLPGHLHDLWQNHYPILDADNIALGPTGIFEAFCGLRDLAYNDRRSIAPEDEEAASNAVGAFLRIELARHNIDWFNQLDELATSSPTIKPLLTNKKVQGDRLLQDLPELARMAGTTDAVLWECICQAVQN